MQARPGEIDRVLARLLRDDRGRLLAALVHELGRFDLAEDALSEAVTSALEHWARSGVPGKPQGWLLKVARRKAIDRIRRSRRWAERQATLEVLAERDAADEDMDQIPDERLRLIFACCHPAIDPKSQVALTLRLICGLSTEEIARAFLDKPATMGQRLSRAKAKLAGAGIPFAVPEGAGLAERLGSVLAVVYLVFNEGYAATAGAAQLRAGLCDEAIFLGRLLAELQPAAETLGLLSLMLTTHARRAARADAAGAFVPLSEQDRGLWDAGEIASGLARLDAALRLGAPGPYQIKAAISALHVQAARYDQTDWRQMLLLYDGLLRHEASAVVELNRAMVIAELGAEARALALCEALGADLREYQPFHAVRADLLTRLGRRPEAAEAYGRAIALSGNDAERQHLEKRLADL